MTNLIPLQKNELTRTASKIAGFKSNRYAPNTRKAYDSDISEFVQWCEDRGVSADQVGAKQIEEFISFLDDLGRKPTTIKRKVYAISKAFQVAEILNPVRSESVLATLEGMTRTKAREGVKKKQAKPLTIQQVDSKLKELGAIDKPKSRRDAVLILVGLIGAFRRSELAGLKWEQIQEDEKGMTIQMGVTKTDQTGERKQVKIIPFRSNPEKCPVRLLKAWRKENSTDFVFPSITKGGNLNDRPISDRHVDHWIKKLFGPDYSAHSLRAGFITDAARKGANYEQIMRQSGHKSVQTIRTYTRIADAWEANAATLF